MTLPGRLPVSPRPFPGEALSSWVARLAARYEATPDRLMGALLPEASWDKYGIDRVLDHRPLPPRTVAVLAAATGVPAEAVTALRLPPAAGSPNPLWPRRFASVWCHACVVAGLLERGEFHRRAEWGFGGSTVCPEHRVLLGCQCPDCEQPCHPRPVHGRLRLWCDWCRACIDGAGATVPLFEHGALQKLGPSILMTDAAWAVLTHFQADLLHAAHGNAPRGAWVPGADADRFLEAVRKLAFSIAGWPPPNKEDSPWHPGDDVPSKVVGPLVVVAALLDATGVARSHRLLREPLMLVTDGRGACDFGSLYRRLSYVPAPFLRHVLPGCGRSRLLDALRSVVRQVDVSQGPLREQAQYALARRRREPSVWVE